MDSLRGKLLIASPVIVDPQFRRTVVLLAEHGEEGAMGVIINRVSEVTVGDVVSGLAYLGHDADVVHVGGPVQDSSVTVLAEFDDPGQAALLIEADLGFVPAQAADEGAVAAAVRRARIFAGHAGWAPGQLESEMEEQSWIVEPALRADVFTDEPEELWADLLRRKGGEFALIATMPADPSLN